MRFQNRGRGRGRGVAAVNNGRSNGNYGPSKEESTRRKMKEFGLKTAWQTTSMQKYWIRPCIQIIYKFKSLKVIVAFLFQYGIFPAIH